MKTFVECVPCFVRQTIDTMRAVGADEGQMQEALRAVLEHASRMNFEDPPPVMGRDIHRIVRRIAGNGDPFEAIKRRQNEFALELLPRVRALVESAGDPFEAAARMAIAGNIIDLGAKTSLGEREVLATIETALHVPLDGDVSELQAAAEKARSILYLADNAGEIVFDRLLVERLGVERVTLAVRGAPAINDALMADAETAGLTEMVRVIDNGSDAPGTILPDCSREFVEAFEGADLVISKGQGNYETLSHSTDRDVFYLLKAKCPVIARDIGCERGALVVRRSQRCLSG